MGVEIAVEFQSGTSARRSSWLGPRDESKEQYPQLAAAHLWTDTLVERGVSDLRRFAPSDDGANEQWFDPAEALPTLIGLIVYFAQEESGIDLSPGGSRHTGLVVMREPLLLELFAMFSELSVAADRSD